MILQGELLLRTKKKSELSWARGFFVLAVEDRTLFCFGPGGPGLERPRCVVRLSGARVSRVAADDALYKFTIARGSLASRCGELWSRTIACACVAAGALAQYGYVRCAASLLGATGALRSPGAATIWCPSAADDGFVLSPAYAGGCAESLSGRLRVSAKERWDGVDLEAEIRATSARPVAPKRLEAIGERALLLCLVAKDKAEAAKFVDVSARALDDLRGLGPAAKAWDDGAPSDGDGDGYVLLGGGTCQGLLDDADAPWRPWGRALQDARPTYGRRYWSSPRASTFAVRGASYLDDRVKVFASEPPLFELVAADLLLHGDGDGAHPPPGADAAGGAPARGAGSTPSTTRRTECASRGTRTWRPRAARRRPSPSS
ncbi:hypothetical protein JL721_5493 [Aureococcus anophagefferens]|nr:hypothetical protein JL721_5493 [Aureococcus anophagefferens]